MDPKLPQWPGAAGPAPRLRLLALHSFRTSGSIFKEQLRRSKLPADLADLIELVYIDAPNPASGAIPRDVAPFFEGPYYEWFTVESMGDRLEYAADKLDQSLRTVAHTLRTQGPFDGLISFSQGTALTSTLVALQAAGDTTLLEGVPPIKFCILFAGFRPRYEPHAYLWEKKLAIPSLHIFGDKDQLRPQCKELADAFQNPLVLQHTRGHSIPQMNPVQLAVIRAFLTTLQQQQQPDSIPIPSHLLVMNPSAAAAATTDEASSKLGVQSQDRSQRQQEGVQQASSGGHHREGVVVHVGADSSWSKL